MTTAAPPIDADELMNFAERIEQLPADDAHWVDCLFQECLRARMHEAELLSGLAACANDEEDGGEAGAVRSDHDAQLAQVALDAAEWLRTLWNVGYMGAGSFPAPPRSAFPMIELEDVLKSALFARIREGKRPLPFPPPTRHGMPWHDLLESGDAMHDVTAEIVCDDEGQAVGAVVAGCADWLIVEEVDRDCEYVVQHRGKGPLFRLKLGPAGAGLCREPPRWSRRIRLQERGGFRSFVLEWPAADGSVREVPLRAATWERAEAEAGHWIATTHPEMYGQVSFARSP